MQGRTHRPPRSTQHNFMANHIVTLVANHVVGKATKVAICALLLLSMFVLPIHTAQAQKKPRNIIRITEAVKIVGKIQKPQAFYVLHRAPLNYQGLRLKENFLKKVILSVKKAPF